MLPTLSALELALRDSRRAGASSALAWLAAQAAFAGSGLRSAMADPLIVVPDDFPSVFEGSAAQQRAAALGAT